MYLIGLTGGIASGKSAVARRLAEHGAVHIDADQLAREAVEPGTDALARIADEFPGALAEDGTLNRAALGAIVFADPAALSKLNAIVHPAVRALTASRIHEAAERDPHAIVVYDVPLLVEAAPDHAFDLVVVVQAPAETRIHRLVELRGMTEPDARSRVSAQATDAQRLAIADRVIDSSGSLAETLAQADALYPLAVAAERADVTRST